MLIPPRYLLTSKISALLASIEGSRQVIDASYIPPEVEINIRRQSILKSSLFSARIEGNTATFEELSKLAARDQRKREIFNVFKALNWLHRREKKEITVGEIRDLHRMVMDNLIEKQDLGIFRTKPGAIFNSAGVAIYLAPSPSHVDDLVDRLVKFVNSGQESFVPIKASLAHYIFEKIHPFLDGNGRVGRLFMQRVLNIEGYGMRGIMSIEEYLDNHRDNYYTALSTNEKDVTFYLEFMLEAMASSAEVAKGQVLSKQDVDLSQFLLPRRAEILSIIKDHKMINFDSIRRRFRTINERTLRYDIKKLVDLRLVKKRGTTKGVYYEFNEK